MRVVVACDWFLKYAVSQANALSRAGTDVLLLCRSHSLEFGGSTTERDDLLDSLNAVPVAVLPGRISSVPSMGDVVTLWRRIRTWRPDIVHAHDHADPRLLAILAGTTRVTTIHDPVPHPGQPLLSRSERLVRRRLIKGSASVVVHGRALVDELPEWMRRRRVAVIPHGAPVRERPLPCPATPSVLLFGRLEPYKGIEVLLRAMDRVWVERPDVKLCIAGAGPAAALVPRHPSVELRADYVPEDQVEQLFAQASLAVLPYEQASQSGVGSLTLGHGLPTIVSDVGALPELALDETFLVAAGDDRALALAILEHVGHDGALRERVLRFAREHISWEHCAQESLSLYTSILRSES